jgi:hypothetical protein
MIQALIMEYSVTSPGLSLDEILNSIGFVHCGPPNSGPFPVAEILTSGATTAQTVGSIQGWKYA